MFFLAPTEAYLIFKLINKSESGYLSLDEFYGKLMHVVFRNTCDGGSILFIFFGKLNNISSEFFCPSFIQKSQFKFAQLLIYISKVNQSAAVSEVVSKKVKRKMRHKYQDSPKPMSHIGIKLEQCVSFFANVQLVFSHPQPVK